MKNKRALQILFLANAISGFSQGVTMLAIPWYFTNHNQYPLYMFFYGLVTVGSLFWGLYAGALIDGFNRKDVFLGTNFIQGLIILSIASLGFKEGSLPISLIIMVFTTTFFGYIIHYPNLYAFAQEISDPKDYTNVTSYIEIVGQFTYIASSVLGVFLLDGVHTIEEFNFFGYVFSVPIEIRKWELHELFLLNSITYIISFVMIIFIRYVPVVNMTYIDEGDLSERLKTGYDFLKNNKLITMFGICSYSVFIVLMVERFGLIANYVNNHLQERGNVLSLSEALYATGSLAVGFIAGNVFESLPFFVRHFIRGFVLILTGYNIIFGNDPMPYIIATILLLPFFFANNYISRIMKNAPIPMLIITFVIITSVGLFVNAFTQNPIVFFFVSFYLGIANAGSRIFRITYLFLLVPNEITGRVNSMFNVITTVFRSLFIWIFTIPFFSILSNVTYAYMCLGTFTTIAAIILITNYKKFLALTDKILEQQRSH
ncbi:MAG: MFS transporter [Cytophagaceae bacterium]|nr:MFS transporter [Cytophagaceae bacterium]MDW8456498.1 MFS transporter [Cytophagaceae bacterium]